MKLTINLVLAFFIAIQLSAQDKVKFIDLVDKDFKKVLQLSKEKKKDVFLYFSLDVCAPCKKMKKEVFPDKEVANFFNENFICVKSLRRIRGDFSETEKYQKFEKRDDKLREKYNINGNPCFLVLNNKGKVIHRLPRGVKGSGFVNKSELIQFGKNALSDENNYASYKERILNGDYSYETVSAYLELLTPVAMKVVEGHYDNQTQRVLDSYFATQTKDDYSSKNNWYIIKNYVDNASTEPFQYLLKHYKDFYKKYGKGTVDKRIFQVLHWYGFYGNAKRLKKAKKEMENWDYPHVKDKLTLEKIKEKHHKDLNTFAKKVDKIYTKYYQGLSGYINRSAWEIYKESKDENSKINTETLIIAKKWMKLITEEYPEKKYYQETYAKIIEKIRKIE